MTVRRAYSNIKTYTKTPPRAGEGKEYEAAAPGIPGRPVFLYSCGGENFRFRPYANQLVYRFAVFEDYHGGDAHHIEIACGGIVFVDVEFTHLQVFVVFRSDLIDDGS